MKGLLQSKKFRKNLCKWLFMYVGCIALLTTVVTYSRYMSTIQSSDSARVAKFAIDVTSNEFCSDEVTEFCNQKTYRSTSYIDYYFTIDTTELEVKTQLVVTLYINRNFSIVGGGMLEYDDDAVREIPINSTNAYEQGTYQYVSIEDNLMNTIEAGKGSKKIYRVRIKYNGTKYTEFAGVDQNDIIRVSYSAVQLAK